MRPLTTMKITIINLFLLLTTLSGWCLSPQLTVPRIGDKVTALNLAIEPLFNDSLELYPHFDCYAIESKFDLRIWAPSSLDTTSSFVITGDRITEHVRLTNDSLFIISRIKPGMTREFEPAPFYGYPPLDFSERKIETKGRTESIGEYTTAGAHQTEVIKGLYAVTWYNDTIPDVECVKRTIKETLIYDGKDTTVYSECSKTWYAPGYRYPILWNEEGRLTDPRGELIDEISNWYMIEFQEQEDNIKDDPVNELIRQRRAHIKDNRSTDEKEKGKRTSPEDSDNSINYDPEKKLITISPRLFTGDKFKAYILCDISGHVYSYGEIGSDSVSISTAGYNPGTYLVQVATESDPLIFKFVITSR